MRWYSGVANACVGEGNHRLPTWRQEYRVQADTIEEAEALIVEEATHDATDELRIWMPVIMAEEPT